MAALDPSVSVTTAPTSALPDQGLAEAAFARVKPEIDALRADAVARVTVDLLKAGIRGVGIVPRILMHRDAIAELPHFPIAMVDKLQDYAFAMLYAEATAKPPPIDPALQKLVDEGTQLRNGLMVACEPLVHFGVFTESQVAKFRAGTGHADLVGDLIGMEALFRGSWSNIRGSSPITEEMLDRAARLGSRLALMLGPKHIGAQVGERATASADNDVRARAFTLFVAAYEQCRHAIAFVRRDHGDAETIAPTIFFHGRRRGATSEEAVEPGPATLDSVMVAPTPAPVAPAPPAAGGTTQ